MKISSSFNLPRLVFVFIGFFLIGFGLLLPTISSQAQSLTQDTPTGSQLPVVQAVDKQAEVVQSKQQSAVDLQKDIADLKKQNDSLDKEILGLQKRQTELETRISKLNELKNLAVNQPLPATGTQPDAASGGPDIEQQIKDAGTQLLQIQTELAVKTAEKKANEQYIQNAQSQLEDKSIQAKEESLSLQSQLWDLANRVGVFLLLLVLYFVILQCLGWLNSQLVKNELVRKIIQTTAWIIYLLATILTILIAFIGNLSYLLTGLGVLSAALVLALQDFVSSFFAWLLIRFKNQYHTRDVIKVTTPSQGQITGVVTEIGLFRTELRELTGNVDELNSERPTGRALSFPNNLILKEAVINFTKDNRILWHSLDVVITFESSIDKAQKVLDEICKEQFEYALDHKDEFLDDAYNLRYIYKPRVYLSIANSGPRFTIWFAARYGKYREVMEAFSRKILSQFPTYGIDIAYNTNRVITTPIDANGEHITFRSSPAIPSDILA
jgi:small-conductance mechanosensitive channel